MRVAIFAAIGAALFVAIGLATFGLAEPETLKWQVENPDVAVGQHVRLSVRVVDASGKPVVGPVTIASSRLDMGPQGMPTMTAPLRVLDPPKQGLVTFETDIPMAGKWALTLSGKIAGRSDTISGQVVFTARAAPSHAAPSRTPSGQRRIAYYRAPMSPDTSPVPKKDAMGMDYIPVYADAALKVPGAIRISPERIQRAGVRLEVVGRRNLSQTLRASGSVDHDESRLAIVTSKFSGFVEKLFVSVTGAEVHPGQPLARVWIESNDILAKEADYLIALRGIGAPGDAKRAENNLRFFGVPETMIQELKRTGQPVRSITLTSPLHGIVIEKPAIPGMRFAAGDTLFKIADHSVVWVIAQVAERDLAALKVGETARIRLAAYADTPFQGRVAFIYPELDMATRTVQVRIEVANPDGRIKIGQYADVAIQAPFPGGPVVAIPEPAIVDDGTRQVAFVAKEGGVFEPRALVLGRRAGGYVEVRQGLAEGERIVSSGNFLIDAESNLQTALSTFAPSGSAR